MIYAVIISSVIAAIVAAFIAGLILKKKVQAYFDDLHAKVDSLLFKLNSK